MKGIPSSPPNPIPPPTSHPPPSTSQPTSLQQEPNSNPNPHSEQNHRYQALQKRASSTTNPFWAGLRNGGHGGGWKSKASKANCQRAALVLLGLLLCGLWMAFGSLSSIRVAPSKHEEEEGDAGALRPSLLESTGISEITTPDDSSTPVKPLVAPPGNSLAPLGEAQVTSTSSQSLSSPLSVVSRAAVASTLPMEITLEGSPLTSQFHSYIHYDEDVEADLGILNSTSHEACLERCLAVPGCLTVLVHSNTEENSTDAESAGSPTFTCLLRSKRGSRFSVVLRRGAMFYFRLTVAEVEGLSLLGALEMSDVLDTWKLPRGMKTKTDNFFAICCIVKVDTLSELIDLREWVFHHIYYFHPGKIYVYDHDSPISIASGLNDYVIAGNVQVIKYDLKTMRMRQELRSSVQLTSYWHCLTRSRAKHHYVALIDWDEFLWLNEYWRKRGLKAFLRQFEAGVGVQWVMYGTTGHLWRQRGVRKSFTSCSADPKRHIKSIVRPPFVAAVTGTPHAFYMKGNETFRYQVLDETFAPTRGPYAENLSTNNISIHHYVLKSKQDFNLRLRRGVPRTGKSKSWDFFNGMEEGMDKTCTELSNVV
eukprot:TRINITY_DN465_c0_g1_i4.p1 TRINITY_DN465_c0_g1~~TRINITY_DN465_c0_g1_i4.p1  ORF type:complete len:593 (+),score=19.45 TRINITY_DN465_c0_g1_i4:273-2051(+)